MARITVAYLRVSRAKLQDVAMQRPVIQRWLDDNGITDAEWVEDEVSGRKKFREKWERIKGLIRFGRVERVVCYRYDRLGRIASEALTLADEAKARSTDIVSVSDNKRLKDADGVFMYGLLALLAQREAEVLSQRTKDGMAIAKQQGKQVGGSPGGISKRLKEVIPDILLMYKSGRSIKAIAKSLKICRNSVRKVVREPEKHWQTRSEVYQSAPMHKRGKRFQEAHGYLNRAS